MPPDFNARHPSRLCTCSSSSLYPFKSLGFIFTPMLMTLYFTINPIYYSVLYIFESCLQAHKSLEMHITWILQTMFSLSS